KKRRREHLLAPFACLIASRRPRERAVDGECASCKRGQDASCYLAAGGGGGGAAASLVRRGRRGTAGPPHAGSGGIATVTTSGYLFMAPVAASTPRPMMPPKTTLPAAMASVPDGMMLDPVT